MLYNTFDEDKDYLLNKFRNPTFDQSTGLENNEIRKNIERFADEMGDTSPRIFKAKMFEYIARNVQIDVNPHDWFAGFACWDRNSRLINPIFKVLWQKSLGDKEKTKAEREVLNETGAVMLLPDFDHSIPDWDAVLTFGFPGLLKRIREFRDKHEANGTLTKEAKEYFDALEITYEASLELLERLRDFAKMNGNGHPRVQAVENCLDNLINGVPKNIYEVLHMIYLYFIFSEHIDHMQVRSLGNLDNLLYPYYKNDLESGTFNESQIREFIDYFMMQYASINNYWGHPFYLGGTHKNGESKINELSYIILEEFKRLNICSPKIQLKINDNTPEKFLNMAGMIRENNSSLVLISEKAIKRAMMGMGFTEEEARTCDISGCYEYKVRAKEVVTAPLYLNLLKAVELVFYNGVDPMTQKKIGCETGEIKTITSFDEFYQAFIKQLEHIMDVSFECVDDLECYFHDLNPANMFSATIENSLKTAQDAFSCGSVYNNTSVLHTGLASTADALLAIKQFVFEKKELSLAEMKTALANNWSGYEKLRLKILNSKCKFGNGVSEADNLVEAIARLSSNKINKRPNKRNGFYKAAMHSARTFITMGEKTGATPDGRKAGDEMSKNISPVMGMDRNGITALINSVNKIDSAMFPEDYCLDAMLHPVTVQGNEGLEVMKKLVSTYMERGGGSIHFNIFDVNTLRAAQKNPELYEGLQIRVCGWNVRFNDICKEEQDMYIKRAANIQD